MRVKEALIYQDMCDYDGVDVAAIGEKFRHIGTLWNGVEKVAVVGDFRWLEMYIDVADPPTPQRIEYFPREKTDRVFAWLVQD